MLTLRAFSLASFLLAISAAVATAQSRDTNSESVLITLVSGETIEGQILSEDRESLLVETWFGRRTIPRISFVAQRPSDRVREAYRRETQKIDKKKIEDHVSLARWCLAQGFTSGLAAELDLVFRMDSANLFANSIVDKMAPVYRLHGKNIQPPSKPRWARAEVDLLYEAAKRQSFVGAALIREQLASFSMDIQINEAIDHAERGTEPQRFIAVHALGRSDEVRRVRPLYRRALADASPQVRREATLSLIKHDDGTTAGPFIKALMESPHDRVRMNAAESLAMLGDMRAVPHLITALAASGSGAAPRNHVRFGKQTAYLKDFDVEIAQAAVIADPIVDIVQEGVVLDVAVVSVGIQRRILSGSLRQITGADIDGSAQDWANWWRANRSAKTSR